jgi:hypothetical protein
LGTATHQTRLRVTTCASAGPTVASVALTSAVSSGPSIFTEARTRPAATSGSTGAGGGVGATARLVPASGVLEALTGGGGPLGCFHHQTPPAAPPRINEAITTEPKRLRFGG